MSLAPQVKRETIGKIVVEHDLPESHACRLVELSRDSYRHLQVLNEHNVTIKAVTIATGFGISGLAVTRILKQAALFWG